MVLPDILVVADDPDLLAQVACMLQECGHVRKASSGAEALQLSHERAPALILLDSELSQVSGFEIYAALKASQELAQVPVILLCGQDSAEQELAGLALGVCDVISKPPRAHLLLARVKLQLRVSEMAKALLETSAIDPLTGLSTRAHFERELELECARASRSSAPISLLIVAIDQLGSYTAEHGQAMADQALRSLSSVMRAALQRSSDLLARYDDTQFAAILPNTDGVGAMLVAHNLVAAVDAQGVQHLRSPIAGHVTASVGVTVFDVPRRAREPQAFTPAARELLAAARRAVLSAKHAGGHCVCFVAVAEVVKGAPAPTDPQGGAQ